MTTIYTYTIIILVFRKLGYFMAYIIDHKTLLSFQIYGFTSFIIGYMRYFPWANQKVFKVAKTLRYFFVLRIWVSIYSEWSTLAEAGNMNSLGTARLSEGTIYYHRGIIWFILRWSTKSYSKYNSRDSKEG